MPSVIVRANVHWGERRGEDRGERQCWLFVDKRRNKVTSRSAVFNSVMNGIDDDSPWDADPNPSHAHQSEWSKITSDFTNVCHCSSSPINSKLTI